MPPIDSNDENLQEERSHSTSEGENATIEPMPPELRVGHHQPRRPGSQFLEILKIILIHLNCHFTRWLPIGIVPSTLSPNLHTDRRD
ncbi:hypothetical protein EVAR_50555_1 [Eumeta japonica]|uniref:Uncharacterized protein n=1 Tax=Eumeta variegata TaxID=151549 RepID=A0A4C2AEE2_EUMVA|nr:hypothetical protein EVAR_50555_1 [Eumeta japonica]